MDIRKTLIKTIREVPDFPLKGVNFKDIHPIFLDPALMGSCAFSLASHWADQGITKVLGIESRGFLLGPMIARELNCGFVLVRKAGKLPPETHSTSYTLEYGSATIEVSRNTLQKGDRVLIHDDLLATGGTASAAAKLVRDLGGEVGGFCFIVDLPFLKGNEKLKPFSQQIHSLVAYND